MIAPLDPSFMRPPGLVPGDIVKIGSGDGIPADCRLCEKDVKPIQVDQAALTGESLPVNMRYGDVAKMGSTCTSGETLAMVDSTGGKTFFGKTASMIVSSDEMGHFQKVTARLPSSSAPRASLVSKAPGIQASRPLACCNFMLKT